MFRITALYQFTNFPNFQSFQKPLLEQCLMLDLKGTLLLASEGINGTIAGSDEAINKLLSYLEDQPAFSNISSKSAYAPAPPFLRMKVKLKKEIVTMGVEGLDPKTCVGTYVKPKDWNELIENPEVTLIDTRNAYEVQIGSFEGAIDPKTTSFRQFPSYVADHLDPNVHKKVAMFCTGGIRCEKSTAYLLQQGFEEVYHLEGGILKYLEEIPESESLWKGDCFVFDERVTVQHDLAPGFYEMCHACRQPIVPEDKQRPEFQQGVSCHNCFQEKTPAQRERYAMRQQQIDLALSRNEQHIYAADRPKKSREGQD